MAFCPRDAGQAMMTSHAGVGEGLGIGLADAVVGDQHLDLADAQIRAKARRPTFELSAATTTRPARLAISRLMLASPSWCAVARPRRRSRPRRVSRCRG